MGCGPPPTLHHVLLWVAGGGGAWCRRAQDALRTAYMKRSADLKAEKARGQDLGAELLTLVRVLLQPPCGV